MKDTAKFVIGRALTYAPAPIQTRFKEWAELTFWKRNLKQSNGKFYNGHYQEYFTDLFDLTVADFDGADILDVGCGPLGSLEWAKNAGRRVGADPLADDYIKLNKGEHSMEYVAAGAEKLPLPDNTFDYVSLFNSLDHVENVEKSVVEAQRVLKPGGAILLIVEIDHAPTVTEPHRLSESFLDTFTDCDIEMKKIFAINDEHNVYSSISEAQPKPSNGPGIMCSRMVKRAAS